MAVGVHCQCDLRVAEDLHDDAGVQEFGYDPAGRLTEVRDTQGACLTRTYTFDKDSNRTALTEHAPGADGSCSTATAGRHPGRHRCGHPPRPVRLARR